MSKRMKPRICSISAEDVSALTPFKADAIGPRPPYLPAIAITLADCVSPPKDWIELVAFAMYLSQPDEGREYASEVQAYYRVIAGQCVKALFVAARAETEEG